MRNKGVAAFVTDGLARDRAGILAAGLPVFALGISPNSPASTGPGRSARQSFWAAFGVLGRYCGRGRGRRRGNPAGPGRSRACSLACRAGRGKAAEESVKAGATSFLPGTRSSGTPGSFNPDSSVRQIRPANVLYPAPVGIFACRAAGKFLRTCMRLWLPGAGMNQPAIKTTFFDQPRGVSLIAATEFWEQFSIMALQAWPPCSWRPIPPRAGWAWRRVLPSNCSALPLE